MKSAGLFVFSVIAGVVLVLAYGQGADSREEREIRLGEEAILSSLIVSEATSGQRYCDRAPLICSSPNPSELGLRLIASRDSKTVSQSLVNLIGFGIDGGLAEMHACFVLERGSRIAPYLARATVEAIEDHCISMAKRLLARSGKSASGIRIESICSEPTGIEEKIHGLQDALQAGRTCSPGDY